MRFFLDQAHYVEDRLLDKGVIVGDSAEGQPAPVHPWRWPRENKRIGVTAGQAMKPSRWMVPLDDEAKKLYKATFGEEPPERDPFAAIPLTGGTQPVA